MKKREYVTLPELARMLGISRVVVFKKVKAGAPLFFPVIEISRIICR